MKEDMLTLQVTEQTLGRLVTNAKDIRALVEANIGRYDAANYSEDNIADAKHDKAMLNAAAKVLNDRRVAMEREWMKPFAEFKDEVAATVKAIKGASDKIDGVVREVEDRAREEKRAEIQAYFDGKEYGVYVALDRIFDARWLNKSSRMEHVRQEMDGKVADIRHGLETIEALEADKDETDALKVHFMQTLDIHETLRWRKERKELQERIAREAAEREERTREMEERARRALERGKAKQEAAPIEAAPVKPAPATIERTLRVRGTADALMELSAYMHGHGIEFEMVDGDDPFSDVGL